MCGDVIWIFGFEYDCFVIWWDCVFGWFVDCVCFVFCDVVEVVVVIECFGDGGDSGGEQDVWCVVFLECYFYCFWYV